MLSAVDCGVPLIANAVPIDTSNTTYGATYAIRCQTGYKSASADDLMTCGSSGNWSTFSCNGKNATRIRINAFHSLLLAGVHCLAFSKSMYVSCDAAGSGQTPYANELAPVVR